MNPNLMQDLAASIGADRRREAERARAASAVARTGLRVRFRLPRRRGTIIAAQGRAAAPPA
jgi:hypothetical protein